MRNVYQKTGSTIPNSNFYAYVEIDCTFLHNLLNFVSFFFNCTYSYVNTRM